MDYTVLKIILKNSGMTNSAIDRYLSSYHELLSTKFFESLVLALKKYGLEAQKEKIEIEVKKYLQDKQSIVQLDDLEANNSIDNLFKSVLEDVYNSPVGLKVLKEISQSIEEMDKQILKSLTANLSKEQKLSILEVFEQALA